MTVATVTLNPCIDKTFSVERMMPDRKLSAANVEAYPGGGGINVARVVRRLGGEVCAHWSSGGDMGRQLGKLLEAEEVQHEPVPIEASVRENLIIRDDSSGEQYRFGMPGPDLRESERKEWIRHVRETPPSVRYAVFSGSLPGNTSPEWYGELLRVVPDGVRVVVDAKRAALRQALAAGVYLIKPNVHELEEVVGHELSDDAAIEKAARGIIDRESAEVVVVSLGRAGVMLATRNSFERIRAPSVRPKSKVGAGDSLVGGMVAALAQDRSLLPAVRFGVAAGAAAVMTAGTELCKKEDVERLYASTRD